MNTIINIIITIGFVIIMLLVVKMVKSMMNHEIEDDFLACPECGSELEPWGSRQFYCKNADCVRHSGRKIQ